MARSQTVRKSRIRSGLLYTFIAAKPGDALRDRYVFSDSCATVAVAPPCDDHSGWLVVVDGIELLELYGPRAQQMAFAAADAFALQVNRLTLKLREQGYVKRQRQLRKR